MQNHTDKIEILLSRLVSLLLSHGEAGWAKAFRNMLEKYISSDDKDQISRDIINMMQGGMGSFNDLVLQKNGKMLKNENNKLYKLREKLWKESLKKIGNKIIKERSKKIRAGMKELNPESPDFAKNYKKLRQLEHMYRDNRTKIYKKSMENADFIIYPTNVDLSQGYFIVQGYYLLCKKCGDLLPMDPNISIKCTCESIKFDVINHKVYFESKNVDVVKLLPLIRKKSNWLINLPRKISKKLRKKKYHDYLINQDGYVIFIKNRGEEATYEDSHCKGRFQIGCYDQKIIHIDNFYFKNKLTKNDANDSEMTMIKKNIASYFKKEVVFD